MTSSLSLPGLKDLRNACVDEVKRREQERSWQATRNCRPRPRRFPVCIAGSPSSALSHPVFGGGFPYRKKGTLILTSLLEDLVWSGRGFFSNQVSKLAIFPGTGGPAGNSLRHSSGLRCRAFLAGSPVSPSAGLQKDRQFLFFFPCA